MGGSDDDDDGNDDDEDDGNDEVVFGQVCLPLYSGAGAKQTLLDGWLVSSGFGFYF